MGAQTITGLDKRLADARWEVVKGIDHHDPNLLTPAQQVALAALAGVPVVNRIKGDKIITEVVGSVGFAWNDGWRVYYKELPR